MVASIEVTIFFCNFANYSLEKPTAMRKNLLTFILT